MSGQLSLSLAQDGEFPSSVGFLLFAWPYGHTCKSIMSKYIFILTMCALYILDNIEVQYLFFLKELAMQAQGLGSDPQSLCERLGMRGVHL